MNFIRRICFILLSLFAITLTTMAVADAPVHAPKTEMWDQFFKHDQFDYLSTTRILYQPTIAICFKDFKKKDDFKEFHDSYSKLCLNCACVDKKINWATVPKRWIWRQYDYFLDYVYIPLAFHFSPQTIEEMHRLCQKEDPSRDWDWHNGRPPEPLLFKENGVQSSSFMQLCDGIMQYMKISDLGD